MPKAALRFWKNARHSLLANEIGDGPKITDGMSPLPFKGRKMRTPTSLTIIRSF